MSHCCAPEEMKTLRICVVAAVQSDPECGKHPRSEFDVMSDDRHSKFNDLERRSWLLLSTNTMEKQTSYFFFIMLSFDILMKVGSTASYVSFLMNYITLSKLRIKKVKH